MTDSGVGYLTSKEGLIRLAIILCGCIAFALVAASGLNPSVVVWTMAAYCISWCFSTLSYFFIATSVASKMECGIPYDVRRTELKFAVRHFSEMFLTYCYVPFQNSWFSRFWKIIYQSYHFAINLSLQVVDVCLTVSSFFHCLMANIILPIYTRSQQWKDSGLRVRIPCHNFLCRGRVHVER